MRFLTNIRKITLFIAIIVAAATVETGYAQQTKWLDNGTFIIDNFQEDIPGHLPFGWYTREAKQLLTKLGAKKRTNYHYTIKKRMGINFFVIVVS